MVKIKQQKMMFNTHKKPLTEIHICVSVHGFTILNCNIKEAVTKQLYLKNPTESILLNISLG